MLAQAALIQSGSEAAITEVVADKGYHDNRLLAHCVELQVRTYIPERKQKHRRWTDKPEEYEAAFRANRRRVRGAKGRRLNRWRSERCERTFAHVCETGGGRRTWLRGLVNVTRAHVLRCAAFNLGLLLRFGQATEQRGPGGGGFMAFSGAPRLRGRPATAPDAMGAFLRAPQPPLRARERNPETGRFLTGC